MLARQTPSDVRTCHQRARDNIRGSSVGTALRRRSGGSFEMARIDKSLPSIADWFPPVDLVGGMMAAVSFDSGMRSHQEERCWIEWWQIEKPVVMAAVTFESGVSSHQDECCWVERWQV